MASCQTTSVQFTGTANNGRAAAEMVSENPEYTTVMFVSMPPLLVNVLVRDTGYRVVEFSTYTMRTGAPVEFAAAPHVFVPAQRTHRGRVGEGYQPHLEGMVTGKKARGHCFKLNTTRWRESTDCPRQGPERAGH
jgi:hypothetical protein